MLSSLKVGDIVRKTTEIGDTKVQRDYKINWINADEVGASSVEDIGLSTILRLKDDNLELLAKAPPDPTSLEAMSNEELKARIEELRMLRQSRTVKPPKVKVTTEEEELISTLNRLSPEQLNKIKEKLGAQNA